MLDYKLHLSVNSSSYVNYSKLPLFKISYLSAHVLRYLSTPLINSSNFTSLFNMLVYFQLIFGLLVIFLLRLFRYPPSFRSLIRLMMHVNPRDRPNISQVINEVQSLMSDNVWLLNKSHLILWGFHRDWSWQRWEISLQFD